MRLPTLRAMRRVLVLCLLLMLPFQGAWAAVAGIAALDAPCAMQQQAAVHGGHAGDASAPDEAPAALSDCEGAADEACCDTGCSCGHGHTPVALIAAPVIVQTCSGCAAVTGSARGAPDHIPEHPLRPPLPHAG